MGILDTLGSVIGVGGGHQYQIKANGTTTPISASEDAQLQRMQAAGRVHFVDDPAGDQDVLDPDATG